MCRFLRKNSDITPHFWLDQAKFVLQETKETDATQRFFREAIKVAITHQEMVSKAAVLLEIYHMCVTNDRPNLAAGYRRRISTEAVDTGVEEACQAIDYYRADDKKMASRLLNKAFDKAEMADDDSLWDALEDIRMRQNPPSFDLLNKLKDIMPPGMLEELERLKNMLPPEMRHEFI